MFIKLNSRATEFIYRSLIWPLLTLIALLAIGTVGYWLLSDGQASLFDGFYMTIITISTIGYEEMIDLSNNVPGRIFTIFIALSGIGVLTYTISKITAFLLEGTLIESLKNENMLNMIEKLAGHYIVCGVGNVGINIAKELYAHNLPCVLIERQDECIKKALKTFDDPFFIKGDATEDAILLDAGIEKAQGLFAAIENDNNNLVLCFTARQLNPKLKIVANNRQTENTDKLKKAGADVVISPAYMGGFRMASEMIRPNVVSLMEAIFEEDLNVEEISIPEQFVGKPLSALNLTQYPETILIAVKNEKTWHYNPPQTYLTRHGDVLTLITSGKRRDQLKKDLAKTFG